MTDPSRSAQAGTRAALLSPALRLVWWGVAAASLWLRSGFPIHAIGDAGADDGLFLHMARNLGAGLWLGPPDNMTLVKGMVYPLFILGAFVAGIPLKLAEHGVYLAASAFVALMIGRSSGRAGAATASFAAFAFNPVLWTVGLSRVLREGLYIGLSLAVVALAVAVAVPRRALGPAALLGGLALGVVGGAFWLTREEGVWLLPALAVIVALGLGGSLRRRQHRTEPGTAQSWAGWLSAAGVPLLVSAAGYFGVVGAEVAVNRHVYGVAETVEVKSKAFERAYGAISRIEPQTWRRYVVFPRDARDLAYRVSPAARELLPALDGKNGEAWRAIGCAASPMPDCTEIQASWFQWALRDAVQEAGHYRSLPEAAQYYERLAQEINDACDRKVIPCLPQRTGLLPPFRWHYIGDAARSALVLGRILLFLGGDDVRRLPSEGLDVAVDLVAETAGPVARTTTTWSIVEARLGAPGSMPLLVVRNPAQPSIRTQIMVAPDQEPPSPRGFPVQRLRLVTDCPAELCELVALTAGETLFLGKVGDLLARPPVDRPDLFFEANRVSGHIGARGQDRRNALIERLAHGIGQVYAVLTPFLLAIGAAGLFSALAVYRLDAVGMTPVVLAVASATAVACRVALLAYMDATSILSRDMLYVSPAAPFVILFAVTGTLMLVEVCAEVLRQRRR